VWDITPASEARGRKRGKERVRARERERASERERAISACGTRTT